MISTGIGVGEFVGRRVSVGVALKSMAVWVNPDSIDSCLEVAKNWSTKLQEITDKEIVTRTRMTFLVRLINLLPPENFRILCIIVQATLGGQIGGDFSISTY